MHPIEVNGPAAIVTLCDALALSKPETPLRPEGPEMAQIKRLAWATVLYMRQIKGHSTLLWHEFKETLTPEERP